MKRTTMVLAAFLTACSTPQTRFADNVGGYQDMCSRMGYQAGSESMANCIRNLYAHDEQASAQRRAAATAVSTAILSMPQPQPLLPPPQVCRWIGPNWVCQ